jgi:hypothetical protein
VYIRTWPGTMGSKGSLAPLSVLWRCRLKE